MVRIECSRSGWGAVYHPETGELHQLNEEHSLEDAKALVNEYGPLSLPAETNSADAEESEGSEEQGSKTESFTCGVNDCSRPVNSPEETCWQHES